MAAIEAITKLGPSAASARAARRFVDTTLAAWSCEDIADVVALLTTELVTNAVLHARTEVRVRLRRQGDGVRVEVADGSPRAPTTVDYGETAQTGRGLLLVDALAQAWGVEARPDGKVVWFEVTVADDLEEAR